VLLHYLAKQETQKFHLNTECCFANEHKTHLNYHLVAVELPFVPKMIDCMHQTLKTYLEREHSILLSVTRTVYVYQVCHGAGRCVTDGSCSSSSLEWKLMDSISGISYYFNKCQSQTLSDTSKMTFFSGRDSLVHMHCVCNAVQLLRRSWLPFSWTMPAQQPGAEWIDYNI